MNKKKILALCFLLIGMSLIGYGLLNAPLSNEAEIQSHYNCGRLTADLRSTDKYCDDNGAAPEARKVYWNTFVYTGAVVSVLGGLYMIMKPRKS